MKKDVIYIDIEDDITAIIGKVKASDAKIVALVPPKRAGALQSVVNLKLLQKTASDIGKQIVLITVDHSLLSLASGVRIPVAKNLQSRPEIAPIPPLENSTEEVINGAEQPIGELEAAMGPKPPAEPETLADEISRKVDLSDTREEIPTLAQKEPSLTQKKPVKVPNFMSFRKWLFLGILGLILLAGFLYWALVIAPKATITITAKTTAVPVERQLKLDSKIATNIAQLQLKTTMQQVKKTASVDFNASGTKDAGNKATTTINLTYSYDSTNVTIPAGTTFTAADGHVFTSTASVTILGATVSGGTVKPGTATVNVQASDIGPEYNVAAQNYTVSGFDKVGATGVAATGGTRQQVTIVTQDDVNKAKTGLSLPDSNSVKAELQKQFGNDMIVLDDSFTADVGDPTPSPAVGEQTKQGKVILEGNYSLSAISKDDLKKVLADSLKDAVNSKPNQSVLNDGSSSAQFKLFNKGNPAQVTMTTTGYVGTTINSQDLVKQFAGKRYGEIEQIANQIPGISKVDIKFSPFWVNQAPTNPSKIDVKLTIVRNDQ